MGGGPKGPGRTTGPAKNGMVWWRMTDTWEGEGRFGRTKGMAVAAENQVGGSHTETIAGTVLETALASREKLKAQPGLGDTGADSAQAMRAGFGARGDARGRAPDNDFFQM